MLETLITHFGFLALSFFIGKKIGKVEGFRIGKNAIEEVLGVKL